MKLQIVSFDIAKDLKELGFDWSSNFGYRIDDGAVGELHEFGLDSLLDTYFETIHAPEQALVVKWLRDVHNIHLYVSCGEYEQEESGEFKNGWYYDDTLFFYDIITVKNNTILDFRVCQKGRCASFENAEFEGIKAALEYLKNDKVSKTKFP